VIFFQAKNSLFLSAGNLVNLMVQGAPFVLLGMAEVFVLLLGEIDLSVGYNAGIGAVATLWAVYTLPWWVAVLIGLASTAFIGLVMGTIITRLGLPSFVVTLAGLLGLEGMIEKADVVAARAFGGTRRTAEYAGAGNAENERAVEGAVAIEDGLPAAGVCLNCYLNGNFGCLWHGGWLRSSFHRFFF